MPDQPAQPERRSFLIKAGAAVIGGVVVLPPLGAGLSTLFDPLRRQATASQFVRVTSLNALPDDGSPRQFPVISSREDAWNKFPQVRVGAGYLRKTAPTVVQAIDVVCPHAGCFVNYSPEQQHYLCPCHNSSFALDGAIKDPKSPSPRPLDGLEVEIRNETEIWVKFQNFRAGSHEKVPV